MIIFHFKYKILYIIFTDNKQLSFNKYLIYLYEYLLTGHLSHNLKCLFPVRVNGSLRDESFNANWFLSIEDARNKIETWLRDYNEFRPHSFPGNMTPDGFAGSLFARADKPDY